MLSFLHGNMSALMELFSNQFFIFLLPFGVHQESAARRGFVMKMKRNGVKIDKSPFQNARVIKS